MKKISYKTAFLPLLVLLISGCAIKNRGTKQTVPVEINIHSNNNYPLSSVNFDYYALKVLDRLEDFNVVDLTLAGDDDTAAIIVDIKIENYTSWPPEERVSRRSYRRTVVAGTDANGKPVYQTVFATADIVTSRIRANALFRASLTIRGVPGKSFKRTFSSYISWDNVYVTNIQGDMRALDPALLTATSPPIPPTEEEILLALSNREMLERLSREIRAYYDK